MVKKISGNYPCTDRIDWVDEESGVTLERDCGKCANCQTEIQIIREQVAELQKRREENQEERAA